MLYRPPSGQVTTGLCLRLIAKLCGSPGTETRIAYTFIRQGGISTPGLLYPTAKYAYRVGETVTLGISDDN